MSELLPNALDTAAAQAACLVAVYLSAAHQLKQWLAVRTLSPPAVEESPPDGPNRAQRQILLVGAVAVLGPVAMNFTSSRLVKDALLFLAAAVNAFPHLKTSLAVAVPSERTVRILRVRGRRAELKVEPAVGPAADVGESAAAPAPAAARRLGVAPLDLAAAAVIAALAAATLMGGTVVPHLVLGPSMVLAMTAAASAFDTVSVRGAVLWCFAGPLALGLVAGLPGLGVHWLTQRPGAQAIARSIFGVGSATQPDTWVRALTAAGIHGFPYILPGVILAVTLRYEHARSSASPAAALAPGAAAPIPRRAPRFARPLTLAGLASLAATAAGVQIAARTGARDQITVLLLGAGATLPVCVGAVALAAAATGQLGAWWAYYEVHVPDMPELAPADTKAAVSAPPADLAIDEKAAI